MLAQWLRLMCIIVYMSRLMLSLTTCAESRNKIVVNIRMEESRLKSTSHLLPKPSCKIKALSISTPTGLFAMRRFFSYFDPRFVIQIMFTLCVPAYIVCGSLCYAILILHAQNSNANRRAHTHKNSQGSKKNRWHF